MEYILIVFLGYALGCFSIARVIARAQGKRISTVGNGNPGASNVTLHFGLKAGVIVAVCDILKAILSGVLASLLFPEVWHANVIAGCAAVIGHMFPFYSGFRGGKGFASFIGMALVVDWRIALIVLALAISLAFSTDYIVAATFSMVIMYSVSVALFYRNLEVFAVMLVVTSIIVVKHIVNIRKIYDGTEPHLSDAWRPKDKKTS